MQNSNSNTPTPRDVESDKKKKVYQQPMLHILASRETEGKASVTPVERKASYAPS